MSRQSEATIPAMKTEASKTRSLDIAFLVDADNLKLLENMLKEMGDALEYQVKFSDGHALQYHSVEEILKQPNSNARSIVSLIAGVTKRGGQSAFVVLKDKTTQPVGSNTSTSPSVEYTINGSQRDVIYLGDRLDEWTAGIRQWYSIFYGIFSFLLFGGIVGGPFLLWKYVFAPAISQAFLKSHDWLQGAFVVGFWTGTYWLLKLFPRATFAIGQGVRRHQFFIYLRRGVLVSFALSVIARLLTSWLSSRP